MYEEQAQQENSETISQEQQGPENKALEQLLHDAALTQESMNEENASEAEKESAAQALKQYELAPEQATEMAVKGIIEVCSLAKDTLNIDVKISHRQLGFLSVLFVPAIMKYAPTVQRYLEDTITNIDDDSLVPEYCAGAGVLAVGGLILWQNKKAKKKTSISAQKETNQEEQPPAAKSEHKTNGN
jgi:hypothetical protein